MPAASAWLRATPQGVSRIGAYYTTNILGGVFGALFAGFYLLRVHDMQFATYVAMALNVVVAVAAYLLARGDTAFQGADAPAAEEKSEAASGDTEVAPGLVLFTIAMSGACALGAQVIWTRNLALLMGGTVYTFSLILGAVLLGLAIGSGMGASMVRTVRSPRAALAMCQIGAMLGLAWAAWWQLMALPNWPINPSLAPSMWFNFQLDFVRALWSVLPAAICWGASFPLAIAALAQTETSPTRAVARVYAANTLGAIGGHIDQQLDPGAVHRHAEDAVAVHAPGAAGCSGDAAAAQRGSATRTVPCCVAGNSCCPVHPVSAAGAQGTGCSGGLRQVGSDLAAGQQQLHLRRRRTQCDAGGVRSGGRCPLLPQRGARCRRRAPWKTCGCNACWANITTLVARDPKNVLVIGCGAGVTAGAVSINPDVKTQTIAEIEPLVPRVVSKYFGNENHHVIDNPKVTVHLDDARHFLLTTDQKFDAITADPFDVWVKGAATLNTLEFYQEMKKHLNPGGVVTAWVAFYEVDSAAWKSELATFMKVFPHAMVFGNTKEGGGYDGVMVGSAEPLSIDVSAIEAKLQQPEFAEVRQSLIDVNYPDAISLFGTFAADASQLSGYLSDAQINRDRILRLQYLAGMAVNRYEQADLYARLKAAGGWKGRSVQG